MRILFKSIIISHNTYFFFLAQINSIMFFSALYLRTTESKYLQVESENKQQQNETRTQTKASTI